uniref:Uncharacterized protein n=1 Tax=Oryza glumipatula TaxID=40148 RepID=A0A0D9ZNG4_9ORYZ
MPRHCAAVESHLQTDVVSAHHSDRIDRLAMPPTSHQAQIAHRHAPSIPHPSCRRRPAIAPPSIPASRLTAPLAPARILRRRQDSSPLASFCTAATGALSTTTAHGGAARVKGQGSGDLWGGEVSLTDVWFDWYYMI